MRFLFFLMGILVCINPLRSQAETVQKISGIEWLVGEWSRINVRAGRTSVEVWKKENGSSLQGFGLTTNGPDTVFLEKLRILEKDGVLFYEADVPQNAAPVQFKLTDLTDHSFTCENPEHDFPKMIQYRLHGDTLTAIISDGEGKGSQFIFKRKND